MFHQATRWLCLSLWLSLYYLYSDGIFWGSHEALVVQPHYINLQVTQGSPYWTVAFFGMLQPPLDEENHQEIACCWL